ncbi:MAG: DJ-1/PfpI family protein [Alphaproteobacteria bacterium]|nr:DJ-1/PfpI family protein [Alphaproteobacteria bacterium]
MVTTPLNIGIVLFDKATLTDFAGPWDVFKRLPDATTYLVGHTPDPVTASGMPVAPTTTWDALDKDDTGLDVICVPGGFGHMTAMEDDVLLGHLRRHAETAAYVTAVCTGALVLGAAGLLKGYRATTHWMSLNRLEQYGATPDPSRVVIDRNRITGGGVTAAMDFALTLAAELRSESIAKSIQLGMEYAPAPPFGDGHPDTADSETIATVKKQYTGGYLEKMAERDARAVAKLKKADV